MNIEMETDNFLWKQYSGVLWERQYGPHSVHVDVCARLWQFACIPSHRVQPDRFYLDECCHRFGCFWLVFSSIFWITFSSKRFRAVFHCDSHAYVVCVAFAQPFRIIQKSGYENISIHSAAALYATTGGLYHTLAKWLRYDFFPADHRLIQRWWIRLVELFAHLHIIISVCHISVQYAVVFGLWPCHYHEQVPFKISAVVSWSALYIVGNDWCQAG